MTKFLWFHPWCRNAVWMLFLADHGSPCILYYLLHYLIVKNIFMNYSHLQFLLLNFYDVTYCVLQQCSCCTFHSKIPLKNILFYVWITRRTSHIFIHFSCDKKTFVCGKSCPSWENGWKVWEIHEIIQTWTIHFWCSFPVFAASHFVIYALYLYWLWNVYNICKSCKVIWTSHIVKTSYLLR